MPLIKVVNLELAGIEAQLTRIGNLLELLLTQNDLNDYVSPEPAMLLYTSDEEEIIDHHVAKSQLRNRAGEK